MSTENLTCHEKLGLNCNEMQEMIGDIKETLKKDYNGDWNQYTFEWSPR